VATSLDRVGDHADERLNGEAIPRGQRLADGLTADERGYSSPCCLMYKQAAEQRRQMRRHEARIAKLEHQRDEARKEYAAWIHEAGVAAVARELGVPAGRLAQRVRLYEGARRVKRRQS
jgi:hypothetical protein